MSGKSNPLADAPPLELQTLIEAAMKLVGTDPQFAITEAEIRGNKYRVFANAPRHLRTIFADSAKFGDQDFLIFKGERLSFAETWSRVCRFAHALENELGVKKGDYVALAMRNYPEWCIAYMAIISLGAVVVPLNAWWKADELEYGLRDSGAKIVIADARRLEYLKPLHEKMGLTLILAREEGEGADFRYEDLLAGSSNTEEPQVDIDPEDDFSLVYTSGSTGQPKGVVLTHRGAVSTLWSWWFVVNTLTLARDGISPMGENPGILLAVPLFHVTGSHSIFMMSMIIGRRLAMIYRWDAKDAARIIREESLTNFVGVPSQSYELTQSVDPGEVPTLMDIGSGGAKRPPDHVKKLKEKFHNANPSSGYGLSETNAIGCVISQNFYQERPDSTGRPVPPVTDIKIVKDGKDVARGEVGEIWIRSPANFRGYHNLPEETAKALTPDGWFRTGDLGRMDEQDFVYIVDRIKDMIIRGGENVSCLEVENRAYEHDGVAEAAVFSVPDDKLGERVGLVVYPKDGAQLHPAELRAFINEELADFKTPERIWISPSPLPRLGTAKFDKITVRKIALEHPPALAI
ncbi:class I adenylate-forming enzyme family protein [Hyphococcus flavus]|uniref:Class I adenylate-forming enzyme family protein n=1 Tax=Hyphococcus flavus TaxID=1866326 RepID=A0AAE9ZEK5_9PROT|nr:class I adenylate-forming enzyme family protein [Hyphococcus flavus]WDI32330.1 class I adenylate-forming enzyme family protein [Hyphococcus flavus]